jgi:hypothetical protein
MTKLQFISIETKRSSQNLVTEADTENRNLFQQNISYQIYDTSSIVAGSPGPFERNTPSGCIALYIFKGGVKGKNMNFHAPAARARGVAPFIPRSIAATVNFFSPIAGTM